MTTYRDFTNLPAGPLGVGEGVNLVRTGYADQKYQWQDGATGLWIAVTDEGSAVSTTTTFLNQKTQRFYYDVATDGGAIGTVTLRGGTIPSGAKIVSYCTDQTVAFASATGAATIGLSVEPGTGDLQALATDITTYMGTTLFAAGSPVSTNNGVLVSAANSTGLTAPIKTTAARSVVMTIALETVTAGTLELDLTYNLEEAAA